MLKNITKTFYASETNYAYGRWHSNNNKSGYTALIDSQMETVNSLNGKVKKSDLVPNGPVSNYLVIILFDGYYTNFYQGLIL